MTWGRVGSGGGSGDQKRDWTTKECCWIERREIPPTGK